MGKKGKIRKKEKGRYLKTDEVRDKGMTGSSTLIVHCCTLHSIQSVLMDNKPNIKILQFSNYALLQYK